jgi:hypothetical protein
LGAVRGNDFGRVIERWRRRSGEAMLVGFYGRALASFFFQMARTGGDRAPAAL